MTLLELVNDVLIRLREPVVTTYNETTYSTLLPSLSMTLSVKLKMLLVGMHLVKQSLSPLLLAHIRMP